MSRDRTVLNNLSKDLIFQKDLFEVLTPLMEYLDEKQLHLVSDECENALSSYEHRGVCSRIFSEIKAELKECMGDYEKLSEEDDEAELNLRPSIPKLNRMNQ